MEGAVSFSDDFTMMIEDAWEKNRKNYINVISEMVDLCLEEKMILLYLAHAKYSAIQIHHYSRMIIDCLFRPNCDLKGPEKILWLILFGNANINFEVTADRNTLQAITSMNKNQLKSATAGLILRNLITKYGDKYKVDIHEFIRYLAKKHGLTV